MIGQPTLLDTIGAKGLNSTHIYKLVGEAEREKPLLEHLCQEIKGDIKCVVKSLSLGPLGGSVG